MVNDSGFELLSHSNPIRSVFGPNNATPSGRCSAATWAEKALRLQRNDREMRNTMCAPYGIQTAIDTYTIYVGYE